MPAPVSCSLNSSQDNYNPHSDLFRHPKSNPKKKTEKISKMIKSKTLLINGKLVIPTCASMIDSHSFAQQNIKEHLEKTRKKLKILLSSFQYFLLVATLTLTLQVFVSFTQTVSE